MNKKIFTMTALCASMVLSFTSCDKNDDPIVEPTIIPSEYIYVLNNGNMGSNDASLSMYNIENNTVTKDAFEARNGRRLGDTGQDIIVYGSKMYITVSGESTIEVTDLEAKTIKQIKTDDQPRYLAIHEGKVYVTYYTGYVARIDTASLNVEAKVQVGRNPEQLTVANGKLYVANSGGADYGTEVGYDKTVSVVDIASFTELKKIEVVLNPTDIESDDAGNIFVISKGNYFDILNTIQKINPQTDEVSVVSNIDGTIMTTATNTLYSVYSQWGVDEIFYYSFNTANNTVLSDNFIGATNISSPYQINYDRAYEHLFITASDYINDGDVYVFDKANKFVNKFEAGLNPMKAVYVKK
jgi:hypothetical protein